MSSGTHDFDLLDQLALLDDEALKARFSDENVAMLRRIATLLSDVTLEAVDQTNFVECIREMRRRKREGSRALGEAILQAADHREQGRAQEANAVLEEFAKECPSEFYRKIALAYRT